MSCYFPNTSTKNVANKPFFVEAGKYHERLRFRATEGGFKVIANFLWVLFSGKATANASSLL